MAWVRWFLLGLMIGLGALGLWSRHRQGAAGVVADFVHQIDTATVRRPAPDVFTVRDVTVAGVTKPAITVQQPSRIAWEVTLPDSAWVEAELALEEPAWTLAGGGALFRIGMSVDGRYEEFITEIIDPFQRADHRRWVPVAVDLSAYAGRTVSVILNTGPGLGTRTNDVAVWGAPRVVTR